MALINPWLAANQLELPTCSKLIAAGNFAIVQQCEAVNVTFNTIITKCGATLKYNNMTIHPNGYELTPYTPCAGNGEFLHVAGRAYHYNGSEWEVAEPTRILPQHQLAHLFKYRTDNTAQFSIRNPSVQEPATDYIQQYAHIALDRLEQANSIKDLPAPGSWWASIHKLTSKWDIFLYTITIIGIAIAAIILSMLLSKIGVFRYLYDILAVFVSCCAGRYGKAKPWNKPAEE